MCLTSVCGLLYFGFDESFNVNKRFVISSVDLIGIYYWYSRGKDDKPIINIFGVFVSLVPYRRNSFGILVYQYLLVTEQL